MKHILLVGSLYFIVLAAGCASGPALRTEQSTSAIRAAEVVGASEVPRAAHHLQLAKEELALAQDLFARDKKAEAASMLLRAEVDGELAILLSREQAEKLEAAQAMERVHLLQNDMR